MGRLLLGILAASSCLLFASEGVAQPWKIFWYAESASGDPRYKESVELLLNVVNEQVPSDRYKSFPIASELPEQEFLVNQSNYTHHFTIRIGFLRDTLTIRLALMEAVRESNQHIRWAPLISETVLSKANDQTAQKLAVISNTRRLLDMIEYLQQVDGKQSVLANCVQDESGSVELERYLTTHYGLDLRTLLLRKGYSVHAIAAPVYDIWCGEAESSPWIRRLFQNIVTADFFEQEASIYWSTASHPGLKVTLPLRGKDRRSRDVMLSKIIGVLDHMADSQPGSP